MDSGLVHVLLSAFPQEARQQNIDPHAKAGANGDNDILYWEGQGYRRQGVFAVITDKEAAHQFGRLSSFIESLLNGYTFNHRHRMSKSV
jgi:hypothetical protein